MIAADQRIGSDISHISLRPALQDELLRRCKKNRAYSLRAFARSLDLSHSSLSRMLSGERIPSRKLSASIIERLGLSNEELEKYRIAKPHVARKNTSKYSAITDKDFSKISSWYHYAIVELSEFKGFSVEARKVSQALGLGVVEARIALEKLEEIGLLKRDRQGRLKRAGGFTNITANMEVAVKRSMQREILEKALYALDHVPLAVRNQTSLTIAVDSKKIDEAVKLITDFRRSLGTLLSSHKSKDSVYIFSLSMFPVTKIKGDPS